MQVSDKVLFHAINFQATVILRSGHACYTRPMASKAKDEQDSSSEDNSASNADKESRSDKDADGDEGQLTAIRKKTGEPDDNLRRRAEWFQKRHRG